MRAETKLKSNVNLSGIISEEYLSDMKVGRFITNTKRPESIIGSQEVNAIEFSSRANSPYKLEENDNSGMSNLNVEDKKNQRSAENRFDSFESRLKLTVTVLMSAVPFCHYIFSGAVLLAVSLLLIAIPASRREILRQRRMVLLTVIISSMSLLVSVINANIIGIFITWGIFLILMDGAYLRSVMNSYLLRISSLTVAAGGIITALIVIVQRVNFENPDHRPYGLAYNPNYLGSIAVLSAVFVIVMLFDGNFKQTGREIIVKSFYALSLICDVITILISESRSSLLALTAAVIVFVFLKGHYVITAVCCVAGAMIWVVGLIDPGIFSWTNSLTEVFSGRVEIWKDAFKSFSSDFFTAMFGRGPMTYYLVKNSEGLTEANHAHNILLDTLINAGIIGFFIYLAIVADILNQAFDLSRKGDKTSFILITVAVCAVAVQGIPDVTIMWHQTAILFMIICAAKKVND